MRRIFPLLLSLFALLLLVAAYLLFAPKFREIGDYRVYRSAQLSAAGLHQRIEARQLVAVLNLRGPNPERAWYQAQQQMLAEQQVQSLDLPLSARILPDILLLQRLVAAPAKASTSRKSKNFSGRSDRNNDPRPQCRCQRAFKSLIDAFATYVMILKHI